MTKEHLADSLRHYSQRTRLLGTLDEEIAGLRELYEKISAGSAPEGEATGELERIRLDLLQKTRTRLRLKAWLNRIDANLAILTRRERAVLTARAIRLMLWTEVGEYMLEEYGESFTRQGLRGIYNRAIDKMLCGQEEKAA